MSRHLSLYKYLPKRRHIEEEEEYERETKSDSVMGTITLNNEYVEAVAETNTHHRIQSIEPTHDIGSVDDTASTPECSPWQLARSFNSEWFQQYSWLEYSAKKDTANYYPCRGPGSPEKAFITSGLRDWKHATGSKGIFLSHNNCIFHKQAVIAWEQFRATTKTESVAKQLGSNRAEHIKKNKHYIKTVAEVLLLCSRQEISFWGHEDSRESLNKGNFKEILSLVAKHYPVVANILFNGPKNALYTSPKIQNNIINIMANMVRQQICTSVQQAGYYSILADETKNMSKQEHLSIVIRYFDGNTHSIVEHFLTFTIASNLTPELLSKYILDIVTLYNLDVYMLSLRVWRCFSNEWFL